MTDQTTALTEAIIEQYDSTKKARMDKELTKIQAQTVPKIK